LAAPVKGDVVVVPIPFSDLTQAKRRPAFILATPPGDDVILCQITSQSIRDACAVPLEDADFEQGGLKQTSNVRPNRLFTADRRIILYRIGSLKREKQAAVTETVVAILRR